MPVTVEQLRGEFPEFRNADFGLLNAKLVDARTLLNESAFGALYDQAVKYQACHLVAMSPEGQFARLDPRKEPDGARTLYERHLIQIKKSIAAPMVV